MLGLEDYGSGSESDTEQAVKSASKVIPAASKPVAKPKKKIIIGLPEPKASATVTHDRDELEDERPAAKKPRLSSGAGSSSLLSMLPAPKRNLPVVPAAGAPNKESQERVLGGGARPGLVFTEGSQPLPPVPSNLTENKESMPNFFSLNSAPKTSLSSSSSSSVLPSVSSAPSVPTFEPPEPTVHDPYPGYFQLPSGRWEMHDPEYYAKFSKKWKQEYDAHVRSLEKQAAKGFEDMDKTQMEEVDADAEMERARREIKDREERKALTRGAGGAPDAPNMKITASKQTKIARTRHQLGTMLMEAYQNREALEEKIAEGRRNRKESALKYGF